MMVKKSETFELRVCKVYTHLTRYSPDCTHFIFLNFVGVKIDRNVILVIASEEVG